MIPSYEKLLERINKLNDKIGSLKPKDKDLSYQIPIIKKYLKKPISLKYNYSKIMTKNKINSIKINNNNIEKKNNNFNIIIDLRKYKNNKSNCKEGFDLLGLNFSKNKFKFKINSIINKTSSNCKSDKNFKKLGNIVDVNIYKFSRNKLLYNKTYSNINRNSNENLSKQKNSMIKEISFGQNVSNKSTINKLENLQILNYKQTNSFYINSKTNINSNNLYRLGFSELNNKNYFNKIYKNENEKNKDKAQSTTMKRFYLNNKNRVNNLNIENPTNLKSNKYLYQYNNLNTKRNNSFNNINNNDKKRILETNNSFPKMNTYTNLKIKNNNSKNENDQNIQKTFFNNNIENIKKSKYSLDNISKIQTSFEVNEENEYKKNVIPGKKFMMNGYKGKNNFNNFDSPKTKFFIEKFENKRLSNNNDDIIQLIKRETNQN